MAHVWKVLRFILIVIMVLFLAPWLVSAVYGQTVNAAGESDIQVEAADPSAAPSAQFFGKAIGSVTAGDLFYIDATDNPQDISVSLYITNADELIHYLRYLILKVAVYFEDKEGQWTKTLLADGSEFRDTYITLQNSPVNLPLPGYARYKITIASGCFYCLSAGYNGSDFTPRFYLDVEPL